MIRWIPVYHGEIPFRLISDELFKVHKLKPTPKWRQQFDNYLKTMPVYYAAVSEELLFFMKLIEIYKRCLLKQAHMTVED